MTAGLYQGATFYFMLTIPPSYPFHGEADDAVVRCVGVSFVVAACVATLRRIVVFRWGHFALLVSVCLCASGPRSNLHGGQVQLLTAFSIELTWLYIAPSTVPHTMLVFSSYSCTLPQHARLYVGLA